MNAIRVERTPGVETVTITSYVLFETDEGGAGDIEVGRVATEIEAILWKNESKEHRMYYRTVEKFTVFRTIDDMKLSEERAKRAKVRELLKTLNCHELDLLRKHIDLLTG